MCIGVHFEFWAAERDWELDWGRDRKLRLAGSFADSVRVQGFLSG